MARRPADVMKEIDGGEGGEAANGGGERNEPEIVLMNDAIVHGEHNEAGLFQRCADKRWQCETDSMNKSYYFSLLKRSKAAMSIVRSLGRRSPERRLAGAMLAPLGDAPGGFAKRRIERA